MYLAEIESDRFLIKSMRPEFVGDEYLSWFQDKSTTSYINYAKENVTIESLRQYVLEKMYSNVAVFLGIFTRVDARHIGNIKFEPIDFEGGTAILGVLIGSQDWRGKGVFTEVLRATEGALKTLGIRRIFLGVDLTNIKAISAYKKNGFRRDLKNHIQVNPEKYCSMVKEV